MARGMACAMGHPRWAKPSARPAPPDDLQSGAEQEQESGQDGEDPRGPEVAFGFHLSVENIPPAILCETPPQREKAVRQQRDLHNDSIWLLPVPPSSAILNKS